MWRFCRVELEITRALLLIISNITSPVGSSEGNLAQYNNNLQHGPHAETRDAMYVGRWPLYLPNYRSVHEHKDHFGSYIYTQTVLTLRTEWYDTRTRTARAQSDTRVDGWHSSWYIRPHIWMLSMTQRFSGFPRWLLLPLLWEGVCWHSPAKVPRRETLFRRQKFNN